MHDVVHADEMLWDLAQGVELSHGHVRWQPLLVWAVGNVDVEAVELCCWRKGAGYVEEPDSVWVRVVRAMDLSGGKKLSLFH